MVHIFLNNLESKHSLLMNFGQFILQNNKFYQKILQKLRPEN